MVPESALRWSPGSRPGGKNPGAPPRVYPTNNVYKNWHHGTGPL